jgi:hypothetical protein
MLCSSAHSAPCAPLAALALGTCEFGGISLKIYYGNSAELAAIPTAEPEIITPNVANAAAVEAVLRLINGSAYPRRSAVRDHDLPEMPAALEMPIGRLGLGEGERPVDHGPQTMQRDGPVHSLEIGAAADADRPDRNAAAG